MNVTGLNYTNVVANYNATNCDIALFDTTQTHYPTVVLKDVPVYVAPSGKGADTMQLQFSISTKKSSDPTNWMEVLSFETEALSS